ncbi:Dynein regulatory complex protein 10, partial [Bienertia sinuspersici]
MQFTYAEGKVEVWSGSIQPHDVWLIKGGFRFEVCFNRYYQPIRKGGAVLVKFVADIAKKSVLCPIGVVNWRNVNKQVQADIVELIREIIIPDGKIYNDAMLKHVGKRRQQWKFDLKLDTSIQLCQQGNKSRMTILEELFEKYADNGREARAMLSHLHTNCSTSFANSIDEFEMEHGREPGGYEFFDRTHKTKDGVYPENTNTHELIDMPKSKIDASVASLSSSKPRIEVEDEVFNELMYDKDNSNQKPIGYGFGVKRSDVVGVKFARHKKETANLIMRLSSSVSDLLTAVQSGRVSPETLAATNLALRTITAQ